MVQLVFFTVGTAKGCMLRKLHLGYDIGMTVCELNVCGASHVWPEEEIENKKHKKNA